MIIDIERANLLEKDIEDYLHINPKHLNFPEMTVERWIARQFEVPSGIVDLIGLTNHETLVVVEVKNGPINAKAITQVSRYAYDIYQIIGVYDHAYPPYIYKIVVGSSLDKQAMFECEAANVYPVVFEAELTLTMGRRSWTDESREQLDSEYRRIASEDIIRSFMERYTEDHPDVATVADETPF
jgi:hypothetical protein